MKNYEHGTLVKDNGNSAEILSVEVSGSINCDCNQNCDCDENYHCDENCDCDENYAGTSASTETVSVDSAVDVSVIIAPHQPPGALDDMDDITHPEPTYEERVARALANNPAPPCKRDKVKDDKLSKVFTYSAIPFFLISIAFSMFNMGRIRYPFSFLFMSFAVGVMCSGNLLRHFNNKKCNCSVCETQSKTFLMSAAIWGLLSIGCFIGFFVMLFTPAK